jgi:hypothetical protein
MTSVSIVAQGSRSLAYSLPKGGSHSRRHRRGGLEQGFFALYFGSLPRQSTLEKRFQIRHKVIQSATISSVSPGIRRSVSAGAGPMKTSV